LEKNEPFTQDRSTENQEINSRGGGGGMLFKRGGTGKSGENIKMSREGKRENLSTPGTTTVLRLLQGLGLKGWEGGVVEGNTS